MSQDNTERYILELAGQDSGALQLINSADAGLSQLYDDTAQLNQLNQIAVGQYDSFAEAAQHFGLTDEQLMSMVDDTSQLIDKNSALADSYDQIATSAGGAQSVIRDIGDLGNDIKAIPEPDLSSFGVDEGSGDDSGGVNPRLFSTAGRLVGGDAGHALRAVGQGARLADSLPEDATALAELGSAGLIAAPALIAASAALQNFNDDLAKDKDRLDAALTAQDNFYAALAQDTTQQAQFQLDAKKKENQELQQEINETQTAIQAKWDQINSQFPAQADDAVDNPLAGTVGLIEGGIRSLIGNNSGLGDLQTKLDGLNQKFQANADTITRLQQGIDNGAFGANNLNDVFNTLTHDGMEILDAAALKLNADSHALAAQQEDEAARRLQIDQMTKAQRDAAIDADERQINVLTRYVGEGNLNEEALKNVAGQVTNLNKDISDLSSASGTAADQALALAQAEQAQTQERQGYLTALANYGDTETKIAQTTQDIAAARTKEQAQELTDYQDYQAKIAQIQSDGAAQQQSLVQDNEDAIARIMRDASTSLQNDVGNRDALQYLQDQQSAQTKLDDQQASYAKELAAQQVNEQQSLTSAQSSYQQDLTQLKSSLQDQLVTKQAALQQLEVDAINYDAQVQAFQQNSYGNILTATQTFGQSLESAFDDIYTHLLQKASGASGSSSSGGYNNPPLPAVTGTAADQVHYPTANAVIGVIAGLFEDLR